ncbi:MAG: RidA family protein [Planctomycetota bacterium]|nr:RidA family protein [Planctomycetota bacterium]
MSLEMINPESWLAPKGYSNGVVAPAGGRLVFVAGQIGWDANQKLVGEDFLSQFRQALDNVVSVMRAAGGSPEDLARLTIYVVDKEEYLSGIREVGAIYRDIMGKHFPAMALVVVKDLLEPGARVEIEGTGVLS